MGKILTNKGLRLRGGSFLTYRPRSLLDAVGSFPIVSIKHFVTTGVGKPQHCRSLRGGYICCLWRCFIHQALCRKPYLDALDLIGKPTFRAFKEVLIRSLKVELLIGKGEEIYLFTLSLRCHRRFSGLLRSYLRA